MRDNVSRQVHTTCGQQALHGASGVISFDANGDPMQQLITINGISGDGRFVPTGYGDAIDGVSDQATLIQTMARLTLQCHRN